MAREIVVKCDCGLNHKVSLHTWRPENDTNDSKRREAIATAIVDDLMQGSSGTADRLVLEVNGRAGGGWSREPMIDRIRIMLRAHCVD